MVSHSFQLQLSSGELQYKGLSVGGTISRTGNTLHLFYKVIWEHEQVVLPLQGTGPLRRDNLWQTTCFECFLAAEDGSGYYELNLSPGGCWNLYHFTAYRDGMAEEQSVAELKVEASRESRLFTLRCSFSLAGCIPADQSISAGLSCVLEHSDGQKSYWALVHPGPQPDFHHSDSFLLKL